MDHNDRTHILKDLKLAMDGRIVERPGSGIATYAAQLRKAQKSLQPDAGLIVDDDCADSLKTDTPATLARRWWTARFSDSRPSLLPAPESPKDWHTRDIYRLAAARFRKRSKMSTLRPTGSNAKGRHLVHWSLPLPVRIEGWVNIYTVHDVIPLTHSQLTPMDERRHAKLLDVLMQQADHIVTVSDHARAEIIRVTGCNPTMITNCGIGIYSAHSNEEIPSFLNKKEYILYAGSDEKRKNIDRIVKSYLSSNIVFPLILVGNHQFYCDHSSNIFCLPKQTDGALKSLMQNALALIFPSLAEGFGLPVIEAMAMGTAVLTSDRGALAEVAGQAALLADPEDVGAITAGIQRLVFDEPLRLHYEQAGPIRAANFSAERFAKRLAALYAALTRPDES